MRKPVAGLSSYRTALACRVVGYDRGQLNEAISRGLYPCAPPTISGSVRLFNVDQMVPLFFYARLTEYGLSASRSGQIAQQVASALADSAFTTVVEIDADGFTVRLDTEKVRETIMERIIKERAQ